MKNNILICTYCGKEFTSFRHGQVSQFKTTGRAYCSKECSGKYKSKISSETMAKTNRKYASERMKKNNPMKNENIREKVRLSLINKGHKPKIQGGNGKGLTLPQSILSSILGWETEYIIKTGGLKYKYKAPNHYKIDIANPKLKIAIEIDGYSHLSLKRQDQDRRKENFLKEIGWKVLRFKNEEILNNLNYCLDVIKNAI